MLDFRNCSTETYDYAMRKKDSDVTAIPQSVLYVLYTKYKSESVKLSATNRVLASDARRRKNMYWKELCRRKKEA